MAVLLQTAVAMAVLLQTAVAMALIVNPKCSVINFYRKPSQMNKEKITDCKGLYLFVII